MKSIGGALALGIAACVLGCVTGEVEPGASPDTASPDSSVDLGGTADPGAADDEGEDLPPEIAPPEVDAGDPGCPEQCSELVDGAVTCVAGGGLCADSDPNDCWVRRCDGETLACVTERRDIVGQGCGPLNVAFVTAPGAPLMDGVDAIDDFCAEQASAAGYPSSTWVAWVSESDAPAADRLEDAVGWVRPDGELFAATIEDLTSGRILYPLLQVPGPPPLETDTYLVATGTKADGTPDPANCTNWTAPGDVLAGHVGAGHARWTEHEVRPNGCTEPGLRVVCLQVEFADAAPEDLTPPAPPEGALRAFVSGQPFSPPEGIAAADALCQAEAEDASAPGGVYRALLATPTAAAIDRFQASGGPWVRADGLVVYPSYTEMALAPGTPAAPIARQIDGVPTDAFVWVGAVDLTAVGTASGTCEGWTGSEGEAVASRAGFGHADWLDQTVPRSCSAEAHVICLQATIADVTECEACDGPGCPVCLIDGACFDAGDPVGEGCGVCEPDVSRYVAQPSDARCSQAVCAPEVCAADLSCEAGPLPEDGTPCDDGDPCSDDVCQSGQCESTPNEDCDCTTDDECQMTCQVGACVDGTCQFTPAPGTSCDDGEVCTVDDTCDAGGLCAGTLDPCDDGLDCTNDSCAAGDGCLNIPLNACVIEDACVLDGAVHPTDGCLACVPEVTTIDWTSTCAVEGPNVVFLAQLPGAPNTLGGVQAAHALCNERAIEADLQPDGATLFKAFLSTDSEPAIDLLKPATGGWLRAPSATGMPVPVAGDWQQVAGGELWAPVLVDHMGNEVLDATATVATGSLAGGLAATGFTCDSWDLGPNFFTSGWPDSVSQTSYFRQDFNAKCVDSEFYVYCFRVAAGEPVIAPEPPVLPDNPRRVFLSMPWTPVGGPKMADTVCQNEAIAAGLTGGMPDDPTYRALLGVPGQPPLVRFTGLAMGPQPPGWFRMDDLPMAMMNIAITNDLIFPPVLDIAAAHVEGLVWTGSDIDAAATDSNCNNWMGDAGGQGGAMWVGRTRGPWFRTEALVDCNQPDVRLICLTDVLPPPPPPP